MVQRDRSSPVAERSKRPLGLLPCESGVPMRQLLLVACLVFVGCQSFQSGESRRAQVADDPMFSTAEQRARARSFYAYPNDDELGPRSGQEPKLLWYPRQ